MQTHTKFKLTKIILLYILLGLIIPASMQSCKRSASKSANPNTTHDKKKTKKIVTEVIKAARVYTGTPYKFGGITKEGMDCSGLLFTSFKDAGIEIPRPSKEQVTFGKEISIKDLQTGDWVCFTDKEGGTKIVHIGMVTEVNGNEDIIVIHAGNKKGVTEEQLFLKYWQKILVKAVRPNCFL